MILIGLPKKSLESDICSVASSGSYIANRTIRLLPHCRNLFRLLKHVYSNGTTRTGVYRRKNNNCFNCFKRPTFRRSPTPNTGFYQLLQWQRVL